MQKQVTFERHLSSTTRKIRFSRGFSGPIFGLNCGQRTFLPFGSPEGIRQLKIQRLRSQAHQSCDRGCLSGRERVIREYGRRRSDSGFDGPCRGCACSDGSYYSCGWVCGTPSISWTSSLRSLEAQQSLSAVPVGGLYDSALSPHRPQNRWSGIGNDGPCERASTAFSQ